MLGIDLVSLVEAAGYIGVAAIIFTESGLFFGFFLPGDSLLFTTGFLASQGLFNIWILIPFLTLAAFSGDQVGYIFGKRVGPPLYSRPNSRFFKQEHLRRAQEFFNTYGARAIVLARFMPVVRTFTPIVAGAASMPYRTFVIYNFVGALLWAAGVTFLGYVLGSRVPNAERYILPIVLIIIISSLLPPIIHLIRSRTQ